MNVKNCRNALIRFGVLTLIVLSPLSAATVKSSDAGKTWKNYEVKTVRAARSSDQLSQYGGFAKSRVSGSGFFQVTKQSGKWWLVDPDGHLFYSLGVNSVRSKRVGREDDASWVKETYELLTESGFNTLGRWSDQDDFETAGTPLPWCNTLSFMKDYVRQKDGGKINVDSRTMPVFDAEWPKFCEEYAMRHAAPLSEDRWLLGHFSDNELPFRPDALNHYLALPATDAGHLAAVKWMKDNRVRQGKVNDPKVQAKFLEVVAKLYFETVANALKKADPNHLYIGSRLHGRCISEPVLKASNACDVVTINYYHAWVPDKTKTSNWAKWSDKPFIVSEFYAMKVASKQVEPEGVGFRVMNHKDAAAFYHTFSAATLRSIPNCVGWHWFKYADDNGSWQKGIVSDKGEVHQTLVDAMKILNEQAYSLRGLR